MSEYNFLLSLSNRLGRYYQLNMRQLLEACDCKTMEAISCMNKNNMGA